jgi:hypothetical protein
MQMTDITDQTITVSIPITEEQVELFASDEGREWLEAALAAALQAEFEEVQAEVMARLLEDPVVTSRLRRRR